MKKTQISKEIIVYPAPAVLVSCGSKREEQNIITIAWTGIINSDPLMTYISVRKERYSHQILLKNREFVINLGTRYVLDQVDYCGMISGRDQKKWEAMNLTPVPAIKVNCPMILESPVNLECRIIDVYSMPSHDMLISEIVAVSVDENLVNGDSVDLHNTDLICYCNNGYFNIGDMIKSIGFSTKEKTDC